MGYNGLCGENLITSTTQTITAEFESLPDKDGANLIMVMTHYETVGFDDPRPAKIQDYGDGIKCIRHFKSNYKGRSLYYVGESVARYQKLWILTVYKKESQEAPKHILDRARSRKDATRQSLSWRTKRRKINEQTTQICGGTFRAEPGIQGRL